MKRATKILPAAFLLLSIGLCHCLQKSGEQEDSFSLVILPDTQIYAWKYPKIFHAQTRWVAANRREYRIKYLLHLGDVVEHNNEEEWEIARKAFARLDGKVPYAIVLGNHDMGPGGSTESRESLFGRFFPPTEFRELPSFGGVYDREPRKAENSYHMFRAGGVKWLLLALEFGPRDDVLRWANGVVRDHPEDAVILITHAYLDSDGRRYDRTMPNQHYPPHSYPIAADGAGLNSGEDIWRKLVAKHPNIVMVVSGHTCVSSRLTSTGEAGNRVHQMLVDYQCEERGGNGYLRLLQFSDGGRKVHVRDYSPVLRAWNDHPDRDFELDLRLP